MNLGPGLTSVGRRIGLGLAAVEVSGELASHRGSARGIKTVPQLANEFDTLFGRESVPGRLGGIELS